MRIKLAKLKPKLKFISHVLSWVRFVFYSVYLSHSSTIVPNLNLPIMKIPTHIVKIFIKFETNIAYLILCYDLCCRFLPAS